jgi:D-amino-acid dehydrogenase
MTEGLPATDEVVVVGGGVVGGFCAWELARAGMPVTVLEQNRFGGACSYGNCGYVSPSHLLPLAQPGVIANTLRAMLKTNSPFAIRPGWSWQSISWFWRFMRSCNQRHMMASASGLHALLQSSKSIYQQLVHEGSLDCQWSEKGILFVFERQRDFEAFAATERLVRENFGVAADAYPRQKLLAMEPSLKPVVAGAWHYPGDCHLCPDRLMKSLRNQLEAAGVKIVEGVRVNRIIQSNGGIQAVQTDRGPWNASQFVFATGAWTDLLGRGLGCSIPIQPGKGYSITIPPTSKMPRIPIIFEDTHVAVTPFEDRFRIGSTMEFVGYDESIRPKRINLLRDSARRYLHVDWRESDEEPWYGWRPMTWDSKPLIGRIPQASNAWICAGHGMLGISSAPASGRLIRELILGEMPHLAPEWYSIARML